MQAASSNGVEPVNTNDLLARYPLFGTIFVIVTAVVTSGVVVCVYGVGTGFQSRWSAATAIACVSSSLATVVLVYSRWKPNSRFTAMVPMAMPPFLLAMLASESFLFVGGVLRIPPLHALLLRHLE